MNINTTDYSVYQTEELVEMDKLIRRLDELGFPVYDLDNTLKELGAELKNRKDVVITTETPIPQDKNDFGTKGEKELYQKYVGKTVRVAKRVDKNQLFFYKGKLLQVLDTKIVMNDEKIGQVVFSFDVINAIEEM